MNQDTARDTAEPAAGAAAPQPSVHAALTQAMRRHQGAGAQVTELERLTGGATKETWAFTLTGAGPAQRLILQRCPAPERPAGAGPQRPAGAGPRVPRLSASEDAALMQLARAHGVPAPEVCVVLDEADGLGDGYVTRHVAGITLGRTVVRDAAYAQARTHMAAQAGHILARIHALPTASAGFLDRLSPADELRLYTALLRTHPVQHPVLEYAVRWIEEHLPAHDEDGVVHADFRTGNLIVGEDGIRCVLDWEIARRGDPLQDLGVLCMRAWRFGGAGPVGGFGQREDFYASYERTSGRTLDVERVCFWEAFANLKWAISCVRRGLAQAPNGRAASLEMAAIGRRLGEPLWDFLDIVAPEAA